MPPDEERSRCSRRRLLAAGGAAAALSTTAGCVATLPPLGRRVRFGRVDAPEAGSPDYRRWLPEPSAFDDPTDPDVAKGIAWFMTFTPNDLGTETVGETFSFPVGLVRPRVDHVGVGYGNYDRVVWYGPTFAVEADVDRTAVRETLSTTGYSEAGTHRGFDLYDRSDLPRAVAVGDDGFVFASGDTALSDVRAVVDARTGASRRYHETDETFALLSSATGNYPWTWFHQTDDEGAMLASASSFAFDDDAVYYVWTRVYREGETPSKAALQRELEENDRALRSEDVDVELDGRVATIEFRHTHERFKEDNKEEAPPPHVTWGLDHDREAQEVTLHHEAGDPVPAEELFVGYAPVVHDEDEPTIDTQFDDEYDTVSPGDSLTVDVSNWPDHEHLDAELRVVWQGEGDESRTADVLLRYDNN
jgi:hypothetical protein